MANITPSISTPIGTVSPRLYGHFAEHLGRCCYGGLWVGLDEQTIPHTRGFRTDVVDALKAMPTPLLRWPGGCYADHYHWRDGIGPRNSRPVKLGISCDLRVEDTNTLGTHEFLDLCEQIGAEPYLAGNMGSGSVQEMCDWVEYCNTDIKTELGKERIANGREKPFGVKLWGVGNENWGCGGNYSAESYAMEFRRYATMLRHVDEKTELVACGFDAPWNRTLMGALRQHMGLIDHLSVHKYFVHGGPGIDFTEAQYYRLLDEADDTERFIIESAEIACSNTTQRKVGIALDEWGGWHPESRVWGPDSAGTMTKDYEQACTVRDAIAVAATLEVFHRQCTKLSMANLAQVVNVLHAPISTDGAAMWVTPTYLVLQLHAPHVGATALRTDVASTHLPNGKRMVSATSSKQGDVVSITVTNRSLTEEAPIKITLAGKVLDLQVLSANSATDQNSADAPDRVKIIAGEFNQEGNVTTFKLGAHSVATIRLSC